MTKFNDPCPSVVRRQKNDARHGHTTSQDALDFIRRTCACESCKKFRATVSRGQELLEAVADKAKQG